MNQTDSPVAVDQIEFAIRSIAKSAIDNEKHFGELDAVVGDGDLGESLARGFEAILPLLDGFDRSSGGTYLKKIGMSVTSKIGGTSGPLWGTGFLRAAAVAGDRASLTREDVRAMLKAATDGIMQRGQSSLGDKTLLDVLVPVTVALGERPGESQLQTYARVADVAAASAEATKTMLAKRGRASYSGERSVGSVDAGAAAVALIIANLRDAYRAREENYA